MIYRQPREHVLIKAFVAQLAAEAFDERILHWFAPRDVMPRQPISGLLENANT
jgi:transposase